MRKAKIKEMLIYEVKSNCLTADATFEKQFLLEKQNLLRKEIEVTVKIKRSKILIWKEKIFCKPRYAIDYENYEAELTPQ